MSKPTAENSTIILLVVGILCFNLFDVAFTTHVVSTLNGRELNPIMEYFLQQGLLTFWLVKMGLISGSVGLAAILHEHYLWNVISGLHLLIGAFLLYGSIVLYELSM